MKDDASGKGLSPVYSMTDENDVAAASATTSDTIDILDVSPPESTQTNSREQNRLLATVNNLVTAQQLNDLLRTHWGSDYSSKQIARAAAVGIQEQEAICFNYGDFLCGIFSDNEIANAEAILKSHVPQMVKNLIIVLVRAAVMGDLGPRRSARLKFNTPSKGKAEDKAEGMTNTTKAEDAKVEEMAPEADESNKEEIIVNYIIDGLGKINYKETEPAGCGNIIKAVREKLLKEAATWAGVNTGTDIPGYQEGHSIHRVANFLMLVVTSELDKFAEYHRYTDSVTDPLACERFAKIGKCELFQANSVRQAMEALVAEVGQIVAQLLREETNVNTLRLVDEERRRDEFKSGPLGHALGIGIGFAGFGRAIVESYAGKITSSFIVEKMRRLHALARMEGESIHNFTRRFFDLYYQIQKDEHQLRENERPLWTAIGSGGFVLDEVYTQVILRTPDEMGQARDPQETFMLTERMRDYKISITNVTAHVTTRRQFDSDVETLSLGVSRLIDAEARSMRSMNGIVTSIYDTDNPQDIGINNLTPTRSSRRGGVTKNFNRNRGGRQQGLRERDANLGDQFTYAAAAASQEKENGPGGQHRMFATTGEFGLDGKRRQDHMVAYFNAMGGTKCAYCGKDDPTKTYDCGRQGVPHDKKHCITEAVDRANGKLGEHATAEYRQIASTRGAKHITHPSSRTMKLPSTMPLAGTLEEIAYIKKTGIIPTSTKYDGPWVRGQGGGGFAPPPPIGTPTNSPGPTAPSSGPDWAKMNQYMEQTAALLTKQNERINELSNTIGMDGYESSDDEEPGAAYKDDDGTMG